MRKGLWLSALLLAGQAWAGDPFISVIGIVGDRAILKVDGQQLMLRQGESNGGVQLVSVSSTGAVVKVNGHERSIPLGMDTSAVSRHVDHSIDIPMNEHGEYLITGLINGRPADFVIDTGANTVSMTTHQADNLGISYRSGREAWIATAGSSPVKAWVITVDSVRVGPVVVHGVTASVRDAADQTPILLGMTFLNEVTVMQEHGVMHLTGR